MSMDARKHILGELEIYADHHEESRAEGDFIIRTEKRKKPQTLWTTETRKGYKRDRQAWDKRVKAAGDFVRTIGNNEEDRWMLLGDDYDKIMWLDGECAHEHRAQERLPPLSQIGERLWRRF